MKFYVQYILGVTDPVCKSRIHYFLSTGTEVLQKRDPQRIRSATLVFDEQRWKRETGRRRKEYQVDCSELCFFFPFNGNLYSNFFNCQI